MAISVDDLNKVRTRVRADHRDPAVSLALKALFRYWSEHKGNPQMEYVPFDSPTADVVIADAACSFFFAYGRKPNEATDAYLNIFDDASTTGTAGDQKDLLAFLEANADAWVVHPDGVPMAAGITIASFTDSPGTTDSGAGEGPAGFILLGAA